MRRKLILKDPDDKQRNMTKFCPKCGSAELNYLPWLGEIYVCRNCGYQGALVIEDGELAREIREKRFEVIKEEETEAESYKGAQKRKG